MSQSVTTINDIVIGKKKCLQFSGVFPDPVGKMMGYTDEMDALMYLKKGHCRKAKNFSLGEVCFTEIRTRGRISTLGKNMHIIPRIHLRDKF